MKKVPLRVRGLLERGMEGFGGARNPSRGARNSKKPPNGGIREKVASQAGLSEAIPVLRTTPTGQALKHFPTQH